MKYVSVTERYDSLDTKNLLDELENFIISMNSEVDEKTVYEKISNILNEKPIFYTNYIINELEGVFYRIRKINSLNLTTNDFWEPPSEIIKCNGRFNEKNEPLLYTTILDFNLAVKESDIQDSDYFLLIKYQNLEQLKLLFSCDKDENAKPFFKTEKSFINYKIITLLLFLLFTAERKDNQLIYKINNYIKKKLYKFNENDFDCLVYRSAKSPNKLNAAFKPESAHKKLKIDEIYYCILENGSIRKLKKILLLENNKIKIVKCKESVMKHSVNGISFNTSDIRTSVSLFYKNDIKKNK